MSRQAALDLAVDVAAAHASATLAAAGLPRVEVTGWVRRRSPSVRC
jgi:hypothetical protein